MAPRAMLRDRAVGALVVWTLLIWTTRLANIWRDDDAAGKVGDTVLASSFTVLALAVVVAAWWDRPQAVRRAVTTLAAWTVGVWVVRSADILLDDWSPGFKVVHTGLAVISIALATLAASAVRRYEAGEGDADPADSATSRASVRHRQPPPALRNSSTRDSATVNPQASS